MKVMKNIGWWILGVIVVGGGVGWFGWKVATAPVLSDEDMRKQELAGCVQHDGKGVHIHPELAIRIQGENFEIPANVGIDSCMHPIHTHDNSGTLHLEFKKPRDVKLSEFFEIWGKSFDWQGAKMTVNGQESTEFGNYVMRDHDQIEIVFD